MEKKTIVVNLWKSLYTGQIYQEADLSWTPKFGGWELIGTITIEK